MYRPIFVTTWCGPDTPGGAESYCLRLAQEMRQAGYPVEIWSTTARGFTYPWFEPYYEQGVEAWNGVPIRHFPVCRYEQVTLFRQQPELLAGMPAFPAEEMTQLVEMPHSDALYVALDREKDACFFFFVYSHNLSFWGGQIAPQRTLLFPTLHDEPYAYHFATTYLMQKVRALLCLSEPERELAIRLCRLPRERTFLVGGGVDTTEPGDGWRFRARFGIQDPFLLYAGRRDAAKQVPDLIHLFSAYYHARNRKELRLLMAGPGDVDIPSGLSKQIVDLGYVSEQDKRDAYAAATLFCLPSRLESLSLALMEAWLQGTPALVNAACAVAVHHCQRSNGGLFYSGYSEFEGCLDYLLQRPALCRRMGSAGRAYVLENYTWPATMQRVVQAAERAGLPLERVSPTGAPQTESDGESSPETRCESSGSGPDAAAAAIGGP